MLGVRPTNLKNALPEEDDGQVKRIHIEEMRRLFAAVNHSLRQPLQAMGLLHGVLTAKIKDEETLKVVARLEQTLDSVMDMLNALLSLDQPEASTVYPEYFQAPAANASLPDKTSAPPSIEAEKSLLPKIFIVDDDREVREGMGDLLKSQGYPVELFESCEQFLAAGPPDSKGCLLLDALLPGMSGLELLKQLKVNNSRMPAIMITGSGDVALAVQAMKAGAADFIEKPVNHRELGAIITNVLQQTKNSPRSLSGRDAAISRLSCLSAREREIMDMVFDGHPSKNIAADLGISQRTVEAHRANIMRKMGVKSLPALLRLTLAAA
jgi:FixJ family two-component response regulator